MAAQVLGGCLTLAIAVATGAAGTAWAHGTTERVSLGPSGVQGNGQSAVGFGAALSADGRFVVFASAASNLVPGDTNGQSDVFVRVFTR
jgi:hypothetical protein